MGLQLPGELVYVMGLIGLNWPEADEEKLFQMGQAWLDFAGRLNQDGQDSQTAAQQVWTQNEGKAVQAFKESWTEAGAAKSLQITGEASLLFGVGLIVYGVIVLGLKIMVIVQLIILAVEIAQAIASAGPTFGASLLEVPVFQQITRAIVQNLIWQVIGEIIGG